MAGLNATEVSVSSEGTALGAGAHQKWLTFACTAILIFFAANQFASEWEMFRAAAHPTGSAVDFPHYYVAAKLAASAAAKKHQFYYPMGAYKSEALGRIPPDTEWNRVAHENGLGDTLHFSATPIVATLMSPLGRMPYQLAFMIWRILSDILFFFALWICLKLCHAFNPVTLLVCTLAGFAFQPFALMQEKGQFGALLLFCWGLGALLAEKKRDFFSALMFAIATMVKLTPIFVVGLFLIRRRWKWLAAYTLWMGLLLGIGVWHLGLENHRLYLSKISALSCGTPGPYNYSLYGMMENIYYGNILNYDQLPPELPRGLCAINKLIGMAVYLTSLGFLYRKNRDGDFVWDLSVLALIVLLIAPFTLRHYYVLEIFPLLFTWFYLRAGKFSRPNWVLAAVIFATLVAATAYPDYLQNHLSIAPVRVFLVALLPLSSLTLLAAILFTYEPATHQAVIRPVTESV
jgi:hypothetical protein